MRVVKLIIDIGSRILALSVKKGTWLAHAVIIYCFLDGEREAVDAIFLMGGGMEGGLYVA